MSKTRPIHLEDYGITKETGYMIDDPVIDLPDYFEPWNKLARDMVKLTTAGQIRDEVLKMPLLDQSKLSSDAELLRAHQMMSAITSGYLRMNGPTDLPQRLPKQIAVPWTDLSKRLGILAGLSYLDIVFANWKLIDPDKSVSMDNVDFIQEYLGGETWSVFIKCNIVVEFAMAKTVEPLQNILRCFDEGDEVGMTTYLEELAVALKEFVSELKVFHTYVNVDDFYTKLAPAFASTSKSNGFPEGIVYEGVSEEPVEVGNDAHHCLCEEFHNVEVRLPRTQSLVKLEAVAASRCVRNLKMMGANAAQHPGIKVLDALLGIEHHSMRQPHLQEFKEFMIPVHLQVIDAVAEKNFSDLVKKSTSEKLKQASQSCVDILTKFRSYHIQIVTRFLVIPINKKMEGNPEASKAVSKGHVNILSFLKGMRNETKKKPHERGGITQKEHRSLSQASEHNVV